MAPRMSPFDMPIAANVVLLTGKLDQAPDSYKSVLFLGQRPPSVNPSISDEAVSIDSAAADIRRPRAAVKERNLLSGTLCN